MAVVVMMMMMEDEEERGGQPDIYSFHACPLVCSAWQQQTSISSGFCISVEDRWFLTNAHSVQDAVVIQVGHEGGPRVVDRRHMAQASWWW